MMADSTASIHAWACLPTIETNRGIRTAYSAMKCIPFTKILLAHYGSEQPWAYPASIPVILKFVHYTSDSQDPTSLAGQPVSTIFEDHLGYLWFGTGNGLSLFEPVTETFSSFKHEPDNTNSLSSSNITTLFEDKDRILWIGTFDKGLNRLDAESESFTHYLHNPEDPPASATTRSWLSTRIVRSAYGSRPPVVG